MGLKKAKFLYTKIVKKEKEFRRWNSFRDDEFIYRPVLVAPIWKISADNNRNFSCSRKRKQKIFLGPTCTIQLFQHFCEKEQ